jgi:hypothetical protein
MTARAIAILLGAMILAAVAHVTVQATGGYGTPHSYVTMAVAAGVAGGSVFCGMAWSAERQLLAVFFVVCIVAGEGFGFFQTANRLIASSEATQAPLRERLEAHAKAADRVKAAKAAVDRLPTTSKRLEKAEAAKAAADAAVVSKSSEKGCAVNCRQLLQAQVDAAAAEVVAARGALEVGNEKVKAELADARAALAGLKAPESATPLADRTGIPQWVLDLFGAGLGSIAANGLACCLMIFGAHHHRRVPHVEIVAAVPARASAEPLAVRARRPRAARRTGKGRALTAKDRAALFAIECLEPNGEADLLAIQARYGSWSAGRPSNKRFPPAQIGRALAELLDETGITVTERDGRLVAIGISLRDPESRAIVPV